MPANTMNILIVDDHNLVLEGVAKIFRDIPEVGEIDAFNKGAPACEALQSKRYDVCVIDLKLPDMDGFELIKHIRRQHSDAKILVCTMLENAAVVNRLLHANIDGVVFKMSAAEHVSKALQAVSAGEKYYCPRFALLEQQFRAKRKRRGIDASCLLTQRELEVLGYIAEGMTSIEMAKKMGVSENNVEGFRKSLLEKTGARNAAQLVAYAYESNLAGSGSQ